MYIEKERWQLLKQKFPLFIVLTVAQTIINFYYPPFTRLGPYLGPIAKVILSITSAIFFGIIFLFPEYFGRSHGTFLDDYPLAKIVFKIVPMILGSALTFFFFWHINFLHLSGIWYGILYVNFIIIYTILTIATNSEE